MREGTFLKRVLWDLVLTSPIVFAPSALQTMLDGSYGSSDVEWRVFVTVILVWTGGIGVYWGARYRNAAARVKSWPEWVEVDENGARKRYWIGAHGFPALEEPHRVTGGTLVMDANGGVVASLVNDQVFISAPGRFDKGAIPLPGNMLGSRLLAVTEIQQKVLLVVAGTQTHRLTLGIDGDWESDRVVDHSCARAAAFVFNWILIADAAGVLRAVPLNRPDDAQQENVLLALDRVHTQIREVHDIDCFERERDVSLAVVGVPIPQTESGDGTKILDQLYRRRSVRGGLVLLTIGWALFETEEVAPLRPVLVEAGLRVGVNVVRVIGRSKGPSAVDVITSNGGAEVLHRYRMSRRSD